MYDDSVSWPVVRAHAARKSVTAKPKMPVSLFIAVVFAERRDFDGDLKLDSLKGHGAWESFLGTTEKEAVEKALAKRDAWDTSPIDRKTYVVYVGQLTNRVQAPVSYKLVKLA